jgi:hypothetical protein
MLCCHPSWWSRRASQPGTLPLCCAASRAGGLGGPASPARCHKVVLPSELSVKEGQPARHATTMLCCQPSWGPGKASQPGTLSQCCAASRTGRREGPASLARCCLLRLAVLPELAGPPRPPAQPGTLPQGSASSRAGGLEGPASLARCHYALLLPELAAWESRPAQPGTLLPAVTRCAASRVGGLGGPASPARCHNAVLPAELAVKEGQPARHTTTMLCCQPSWGPGRASQPGTLPQCCAASRAGGLGGPASLAHCHNAVLLAELGAGKGQPAWHAAACCDSLCCPTWLALPGRQLSPARCCLL